jgi:hypothetical protein
MKSCDCANRGAHAEAASRLFHIDRDTTAHRVRRSERRMRQHHLLRRAHLRERRSRRVRRWRPRQVRLSSERRLRTAQDDLRPLECGSIADGCGGVVKCPRCDQQTGTAGMTCGGGGRPNVCGAPPIVACTKRTCADAGAACGFIADGCGGVLDCGRCAQGATCGVVTPNQCSNPFVWEHSFCCMDPSVGTSLRCRCEPNRVSTNALPPCGLLTLVPSCSALACERFDRPILAAGGYGGGAGGF